MKRRIVATSVAALTVAAGGAAAIAATGDSQQEDSKAVIDDAAKDLGVQPSELSDALKKALANRNPMWWLPPAGSPGPKATR